jgi:hypothetical protein
MHTRTILAMSGVGQMRTIASWPPAAIHCPSCEKATLRICEQQTSTLRWSVVQAYMGANSRRRQPAPSAGNIRDAHRVLPSSGMRISSHNTAAVCRHCSASQLGSRQIISWLAQRRAQNGPCQHARRETDVFDVVVQRPRNAPGCPQRR